MCKLVVQMHKMCQRARYEGCDARGRERMRARERGRGKDEKGVAPGEVAQSVCSERK